MPDSGRTPQTSSVVVVEADAAVRGAFCRALADAGFDSLGASDGADAIRCLEDGKATPIAIVMSLVSPELDLVSPAMDGRRLRSWLDRHPRLASVPFVVLARGSAQAVGQELRATASAEKPIDPVALVALVRRVTRGR